MAQSSYRSEWGRRARESGQTYEAIANLSFDVYKRDGRASWTINYPQTRITKFPHAIIVGRAYPDRHVTLKTLGGRTCWIDVKSWQARDRNSYPLTGHPDAVAQLEKMREEITFGALCFYLVCWRWNGNEEWRLHPVESLAEENGNLVFLREKGYFADSSQGYPDWLGVLEENYRTGL